MDQQTPKVNLNKHSNTAKDDLLIDFDDNPINSVISFKPDELKLLPMIRTSKSKSSDQDKMDDSSKSVQLSFKKVDKVVVHEIKNDISDEENTFIELDHKICKKKKTNEFNHNIINNFSNKIRDSPFHKAFN